MDALIAAALAPPLSRPRLFAAYAGAGRRLGFEPVEHEGRAWRRADLGRVALIEGALAALDPLEHRALLEDLFFRGDNDERRAVLMALPRLPDPGRFRELAVEACRTNVKPVFEAIACANPYPAAHFDELAFNQMVLKAFFLGAPASAIVGIERRKSAELIRMTRAFASERAAAGRPVPPDLALVLGAPT